eukprot:CAMPEP_0198359808 /NCGR_PEP_ID=MMETSP1450-20131203/135920_1 /TAXON_ID=753684 ORGANISM="Madagascaria erythrocladiodes, Strain CCMP3234" /NCGR_SAMPLE_ID=MMETSP1450 /ASSEMBLY_ACC=CAM_ASM_001115 /LENGTH=368 /DNA_ID=CAMNT_0044066723 /DNA_START=26 /DNA_END=1132 /DNA_ORIENTATION=+
MATAASTTPLRFAPSAAQLDDVAIRALYASGAANTALERVAPWHVGSHDALRALVHYATTYVPAVAPVVIWALITMNSDGGDVLIDGCAEVDADQDPTQAAYSLQACLTNGCPTRHAIPRYNYAVDDVKLWLTVATQATMVVLLAVVIHFAAKAYRATLQARELLSHGLVLRNNRRGAAYRIAVMLVVACVWLVLSTTTYALKVSSPVQVYDCTAFASMFVKFHHGPLLMDTLTQLGVLVLACKDHVMRYWSLRKNPYGASLHLSRVLQNVRGQDLVGFSAITLDEFVRVTKAYERHLAAAGETTALRHHRYVSGRGPTYTFFTTKLSADEQAAAASRRFRYVYKHAAILRLPLHADADGGGAAGADK